MGLALNEMKNGAITLLDILGWKGIWQRNTAPIETLEKLVYVATMQEKYATEQFKKSDLQIEIKNISDTLAIVLYTDDCNTALAIQSMICSKLIVESLKLGLPLRGAMCYGKLISNNNIMAGPAVDEVASWYENTEFIGCIFTPSALLSIDHRTFMPHITVEYEVRTKNIGNFKTYCVNWPILWEDGEAKLKEIFKDNSPLIPNIALKYLNTLNFYEYVIGEKVCL